MCTGEKKCRPTKRSGAWLARARPEIGRVEVLLANTPFGASIGSASRVTAALSSRFSKTASMIRSQPSRARASAAGVTSASSFASPAASMRPLATCGAVMRRIASMPAFALSSETSFSTQAMPRAALAWAMPAPIMPAPRTPTFFACPVAKPAGRDWPDLMALRSKKNAWIMFFAVCVTMTLASFLLSMRVAVS